MQAGSLRYDTWSRGGGRRKAAGVLSVAQPGTHLWIDLTIRLLSPRDTRMRPGGRLGSLARYLAIDATSVLQENPFYAPPKQSLQMLRERLGPKQKTSPSVAFVWVRGLTRASDYRL